MRTVAPAVSSLLAFLVASASACGSGSSETKKADPTATDTATATDTSAATATATDTGTGTETSAETALPVDGVENAALKPFDDLITGLLAEWGGTGAVLAVRRDDELVYLRAFGYADFGAQKPMKVSSVSRLGSVSKGITAAAIMRLADESKLAFDDKLLDRLSPAVKNVCGGGAIGTGIADVTLRQAMRHQAGWDWGVSGDIAFRHADAMTACGLAEPPNGESLARFILKAPLDYTPGSKYVYSNADYTLLARVVENVGGKPYETYVQEMLAPYGITSMRLAGSLLSERRDDEVVYHTDAPSVGTVFPNVPSDVPPQYGAYRLAALDGAGGWTATASDVMKYVLALDGRRGATPLVSSASRTAMTEAPAQATWINPNLYYGFGWLVPAGDAGKSFVHGGELDGLRTYVVHTEHLTFVVFYNFVNVALEKQGRNLLEETETKFWEAANAIKEWPTQDLFD